jgi:phospholipid N-methyltransferase
MEQTAKRRRNGARLNHKELPVPGNRSDALALNSALGFMRAFVREPLKTGSVWPSSRELSRVVVDCCQIKPGDMVVELGPGSGAFTLPILNRLNGRGRFLAVEINPVHAGNLRRNWPRCEVVHDSAENLFSHMKGRRADCIVSGLAWGNMLPRTQDRILQATLKSLSADGQFVSYVQAVPPPVATEFSRG